MGRVAFVLVRLRGGATLLAFSALAVFQLGGCAYSNTTLQRGPASSHGPQAGDGIAVMLAEQTAARGSTQIGPGRVLVDLTLSVVQEKFPTARLIETDQEGEALQRCRQSGVAYLLAPTIGHWGNLETIQSRFADSVSVDLRLLQVSSGQLVRSIHYEGSNNSMTIGSHAPEALMDENFRDAVKSLLRGD